MASPPTDGRHPDNGDVTRDADGGPDRIPKEHAAARAIQDRIKLLLLYETFLIYEPTDAPGPHSRMRAKTVDRRAAAARGAPPPRARHRSDGAAARARANAAWSRLRRNDGAGARPRSQRQQEPKSAPEAIVAGPRRGRAHSRRGAALRARARAPRRVRLHGGPAARSHPPYVCTPTATRRPSPTANDYCSQIRDCQWPLPSVSLSSLSTASQRPTEVL